MTKRISLILALAALNGCERFQSTENPVPGTNANASVDTDSAGYSRTSPEPETPVSEDIAAELSKEFGLVNCSKAVRLRDVRVEGLLVESWRIPEGKKCFADFNELVSKYSIWKYVEKEQTERSQIRWLCLERGDHVLKCTTQDAEPKLVIEQPRLADFLLFRRINKLSF